MLVNINFIHGTRNCRIYSYICFDCYREASTRVLYVQSVCSVRRLRARRTVNIHNVLFYGSHIFRLVETTQIISNYFRNAIVAGKIFRITGIII